MNKELANKYSTRFLELLEVVNSMPKSLDNDTKFREELLLCGEIAAKTSINPETDVCEIIRVRALEKMKGRMR